MGYFQEFQQYPAQRQGLGQFQQVAGRCFQLVGRQLASSLSVAINGSSIKFYADGVYKNNRTGLNQVQLSTNSLKAGINIHNNDKWGAPWTNCGFPRWNAAWIG